jgi:c-di-GMP-binding flagellar brake protein YcgR
MRRPEIPHIPLIVTLRGGQESWPGTLHATDAQRWLLRIAPLPCSNPASLVGRIVQVQFSGPGGLYTFASPIEQVLLQDQSLLVVHAPQQMNRWDRRRYVRLPRQLRVEGAIHGTNKAHLLDTMTYDIGRGGIAIPAPNTVAVDDSVTLEIYLSSFEEAGVQAVGRVANVRPLPGGGPAGQVLAGIEFVGMPGEDAARWLRYVSREERATAMQQAAA